MHYTRVCPNTLEPDMDPADVSVADAPGPDPHDASLLQQATDRYEWSPV